MTNTQTIAQSLLAHFTFKTRDNGESFTCLKDDAPDHLRESIRHAHNDMMPDDYKYDYFHSALESIANHDNIDNARESIANDVDVYNHDLLKWLSSNLARIDYVDDTASEYGLSADIGILERIRWGQITEREEVFSYVAGYIEELAEESEAA